MKKLLTAGLIVSVVLFLVMGTNYISNEKMIKNYENEIYKINQLDFLGIFQPYIAAYNRGNIEYQMGNYNRAVEYYEDALKKHPPKKKECKIRTNLVLAKIAGIDFENLSQNEVEETIGILEEGIQILTEKNCANEDQQSGHDSQAQQLEIELQQIIDALKNPPSDDKEKDSSDRKQSSSEQSSTEQEEEKSQLQKAFEEQQQDVQKERNDMHDLNELYKMEFDFSDAPVW